MARNHRGGTKSDVMLVRMEPGEKRAFKDAAELAGIPVSAWVRERLRRTARIELEDAGKQVAFVHRYEAETP